MEAVVVKFKNIYKIYLVISCGYITKLFIYWFNFSQKRKKDPGHKAYRVSAFQHTNWQMAIVEAQMLRMFSTDERLTIFDQTLKDDR